MTASLAIYRVDEQGSRWLLSRESLPLDQARERAQEATGDGRLFAADLGIGDNAHLVAEVTGYDLEVYETGKPARRETLQEALF